MVLFWLGEGRISILRRRSVLGDKRVFFLESVVHQAMSMLDKFVLGPFCSLKETPAYMDTITTGLSVIAVSLKY